MRHFDVRIFPDFFIQDTDLDVGAVIGAALAANPLLTQPFGVKTPPTGCYPASLPGGNSE